MDQTTVLHQTHQLSEQTAGLPVLPSCLLDTKPWGFYTEKSEKQWIVTLPTISQEQRWRPQAPSPVKGKM